MLSSSVSCRYVEKCFLLLYWPIYGIFRLGRASGPEGQHLDMPVGPIEQTNHHPVTEAFTDPKLTERHQQQNRVMSTPGDVTNDYKHYSSCAAPPPGPPPNNKGRIRARSAPGRNAIPF